MAQALTSSTVLTQEMQTFYDKVFLERLQLETAYDFLTSKRTVPANSGKVVYFTRETAFTVTSAALTEGTTPTGIIYSATTVSATAAPYGETTTVSTLFELTSIDAGMKEKVSVMGQMAAEKMDTVRLNVMVAGATTRYANAGFINSANPLTALKSTDTLDVADLRTVVLLLKKNKAPKFEAPVGSLNKGGAYRGVVSSQGYYDLLGDSATGAFTAINIATSDSLNGDVRLQSIKRIAGIDIMESNNMYTELSANAGAATDIAYSNLFAGKEAVIEMDIAGSGNPRILYKKPGPTSTENPLDMYSTISWKVDAWACVVANASWLVNMKSYGL